MRIAAITPTRGDERTIFLNWCKHRVIQMGYDHHYVIDFPPLSSDKVDLYQRIAIGVARAKENGFTHVSIIEDDDYYQRNYLEIVRKMLSGGASLVGFGKTTYYHIFKRTYQQMTHTERSSLFTTSFHVDEFVNFPVNPPGYFDIALWSSAKKRNRSINLMLDEFALGIKHGIGLCGGNGHTMQMRNKDINARYLSARIDKEAFDFYQSLKQ